MRNLKKVLSLTLALVMMLGMMTFAGAAETKLTAADFKDMDKVVNKEAVTLLVDLGVLNGIKAADGTYTFNPAGNIERGAYAKMVYAVKMATDKADVYKGANTGLTDVKGHWAEGYIAYCVSTKIAAGNPNKTFTPNANISVVAAAKMLLTALGYDATLSKYENDALWAINIMADAQSAGLMNGVNLGADAVLTRDAAAQMIYNALFAEQVRPIIDRDQGVAYLVNYVNKYTAVAPAVAKNKLGEFVFDLVKVIATVDGITDGKADLSDFTVNNATVTPSKTLTGTLPGSPDVVGSTVAIYVKGSVAATTLTIKEVYSALPVVSASNVLATTTKGFADKAAYDKAVTKGEKSFLAELEADPTTTAPTVKYFLNGANAGGGNPYGNGTSDVKVKGNAGGTTTDIVASMVPGSIVEFIDTNANGKADVVKVTRKTVATVNNDIKTKTATDGTVTVSIPGVTAGYVTAVGYEGLKKDDIVLSLKLGGTTYVEKAASVEGIVAGYHNTNGLKVGDTYYKDSGLTSFVGADHTDYTNTFVFYLDNGKNIIKAVAKTTEETVNYAVLLDADIVTVQGVDGGKYVEAKILKVDGTTEIVKIATVNGAKLVDTSYKAPSTNLWALVDGHSGGAGTDWKVGDGSTAAVVGTFIYKFDETTDVNNYSLKPVAYVADAKADLFDTTPNTMSVTAKQYDADMASTVVADRFLEVGQFYEYSINADGKYVLKSKGMANGATLSALDSATITGGVADFDGSNTNIANANTVFLYGVTPTGGKTTYTAYAGIAKIPSTATATNTATLSVVSAKGVATYVYVTTTGIVNTKTDKAYIYDVDDYSKTVVSGTSYYTYNAIVNGEVGTVKVASLIANVDLYNIDTVDGKGVASLTPMTEVIGVKSAAAGTLVLGDGTSFTYTDDTIVYYIDADGKVTTLTGDSIAADATDAVYVIPATGSLTEAGIIYVGALDNTKATGLVLAAGSAKKLTVNPANDDLLTEIGLATGFASGTTDCLKVTLTQSNGNLTSTMTINGVAYDSGDDYTVAAAGKLNLQVTVKDNFSLAESVYTYVITVQ